MSRLLDKTSAIERSPCPPMQIMVHGLTDEEIREALGRIAIGKYARKVCRACGRFSVGGRDDTTHERCVIVESCDGCGIDVEIKE